MSLHCQVGHSLPCVAGVRGESGHSLSPHHLSHLLGSQKRGAGCVFQITGGRNSWHHEANPRGELILSSVDQGQELV